MKALFKPACNVIWLAAIAALLFSPDAKADNRAQFEKLIAVHARVNNVPEVLVHRVIVRESKYHPDLVGRGGTIGLMQIKLATARGLGYTGDAEGLRDPDTNLAYGVKYLAGAYRAAGSDHDRAMHYYASGYYHVAKQQRLERPRHPAPVLASAAPKEPEPPKQPAPEAKEPAAVPLATTARPEKAAKLKTALRRHAAARKLADLREPVARPPAGISGGANAAKPR